MPRYSHNYEYVLTKLNLSTSLEHRRKVADLVFVNRIFNVPISCQNIIEMFKLNVPSRSPSHSEFFHIEHIMASTTRTIVYLLTLIMHITWYLFVIFHSVSYVVTFEIFIIVSLFVLMDISLPVKNE